MKQVFKADINIKFPSKNPQIVPKKPIEVTTKGVEGSVEFESIRALDETTLRVTARFYTKQGKLMNSLEDYLKVVEAAVAWFGETPLALKDIRNVLMITPGDLKIHFNHEELAVGSDSYGTFYLLDFGMDQKVMNSFETEEEARFAFATELVEINN